VTGPPEVAEVVDGVGGDHLTSAPQTRAAVSTAARCCTVGQRL